MQEFFEKVKDTVSETAKVAVKKSSELVEITKVKFAISEQETSLKNMLCSIGDYVYNRYKNGEIFDETVLEKCSTVDEIHEKINDLEYRVAVLKKEKICAQCAKNNPENACFCIQCGAEF